jgi:hypothetical protein
VVGIVKTILVTEETMKKVILTQCILLLPFLIFAQTGDLYTPRVFEVDMWFPEELERIDNPLSARPVTHQTYADKGYQLRYTFFSQNRKNTPLVREAYTTLVSSLVTVVSGQKNSPPPIQYEDADVLEEFNGDFASTIFLVNPSSDYAKGFTYVLLGFYCKKDLGVVMQAVLFNDLGFVNNAQFMDIVHSFSFL